MSRGDAPDEGMRGMSAPQNGVAAYSAVANISRICQGGFSVAFPAIFIVLSVLLLCQVLPNCRDFPVTSLSLVWCNRIL